MNADMLMIAICQEFGWTYNEYMNTPTWVLDLIKEKMVRDAKEAEMRARKK